ncbi:MAG: ABC-2 family transporter protein [Candidatus Andersenbacteria bacterium]
MQFLVNNIKHLARVWVASARASVVREMEFRGNFIAGLLRQALWLGIFVFFINVIFQNTEQLAGWDKREMLIILSLSRIIEGLINLFFTQNIMELPEAVRDGQFDYYLTKPLPAQFATAFRRPSIDNIGNIVVGLLLFTYALIQEPALFTLLNGGLLIFLATLGIITYYSLLILIGSLVFKLERLEMLWGFNVLFSEPLTLPFDVFPRGPRLLLTYLVPLALVVFFPAQAITGRLLMWQIPVALGITAVFLLLANLAWRAGLRRYSSASS